MSQRKPDLSSLTLTKEQQNEFDSAQSITLTQSGALRVILEDGLENFYVISEDKKISLLMSVTITPEQPPEPVTEVESKYRGYESLFGTRGFNQYGSHSSRQHRFYQSSPVDSGSESDTEDMEMDMDSPRHSPFGN